jgi:hypothetical protein
VSTDEIKGKFWAIRARVGVEGVVRRDAVPVVVDPRPLIEEDRIGADRVAHAVVQHADVVPRDRVRLAGGDSADERVSRRHIQLDARVAVSERLCGRGVRADRVALHDRTGAVVDEDPIEGVCGDQVALAGVEVPADEKTRMNVGVDAVLVRQSLRPGRVRADPVSLDRAAATVDDEDAFAGACRTRLPSPGFGPPIRESVVPVRLMPRCEIGAFRIDVPMRLPG